MDSHVVADQSAVFDLLAAPQTYGSAEPVTRIDTHGAVVFLVGEDAYKVKRAVAFPFMDFSTLAKRHAACEREVVLNRRHAPDLYLGVIPIYSTATGLRFGGAAGAGDTAIEFAVHMRRFDESQTLDLLAAKGLAPDLLADLAMRLAAAHAQAEPCPTWDSPGALLRIAGENAADFAACPEVFPAARAAALDLATRRALERCNSLLERRSARGLVRRCHGDLHLGNIVRIEGRPVLFDAIEFNDAIATCDVLYDLAFLLMDLWERGLHEAANLVFNRYLWAADRDDDYEGLAGLPLFMSLRAAIRAKVIGAGIGHLPADRRSAATTRVLRYFALAEHFLETPPARLVAVGGLSGTGKSTVAAALAPHLDAAPGAALLRSDVERKRMNGLAETERLAPEHYTQAKTVAVYARMRARAELALRAGHSVVADAVHARPQERDAIEATARLVGADFQGVWLSAPIHLLKQRVDARRNDASDATSAIVEAQSSYDLGPIGWRKVDVSAGAAEVARRVMIDLDLAGPKPVNTRCQPQPSDPRP
ncbi:MAG: hypothetical protein B7Z15_08970 [Rhizobiales bacterium 32-66-8]|nr:MAG: hypothetical protein B7Z15_08970 [Rhizobiales bacterium 32-66-8]